VRAIVCTEHGPPEVVRLLDRPSPSPAPGEVRVRVAAAAVNYPDILMIADRYQISVPAPFVPGSECAGFIDEINDSTSDFAVGERVSATVMFGAFAEEVVVPAASLSRIPDVVDTRSAAAFGVAHRTAYHALRSVARVQPGDDVIVLGAGGGVGLAAVQLGSKLGASVTAVASTDQKLDAAVAFGARHRINHRSGDFREHLRDRLPDGADAVIDPVGGELSEPALRALHRGGRFVTVGYASGSIPRIPLNLVLVKGLQILGFQFQDIPAAEFERNEHELRELVASGGVRPYIGATFSLEETAKALRLVADGRAVGKVVIEI
jgi:NADPH2:quinone reductase